LFTYCLAVGMCSCTGAKSNYLSQLNDTFCSQGRFWNCISSSFFLPSFIPFSFSLSVLPHLLSSSSLYLFFSPFIFLSYLVNSFVLSLLIPFSFSLSVLPHVFSSSSLYLFHFPFLFLSYLISFLLPPFIYSFPIPLSICPAWFLCLLSPAFRQQTHEFSAQDPITSFLGLYTLS
jgi:hypothetical protein